MGTIVPNTTVLEGSSLTLERYPLIFLKWTGSARAEKSDAMAKLHLTVMLHSSQRYPIWKKSFAFFKNTLINPNSGKNEAYFFF